MAEKKSDNKAAGRLGQLSQLGDYRRQIDALDTRILALLEKRARLAQKVGADKHRRNLKNFSVPEREAQILRRLKADSALLKPHIAAIYREIISACLACEKPVSAAYLGPAGTFTHEAALKMFGHGARLFPAAAVESVIHAAETEKCDYAVVPFENSAAGTVGETMDALINTPLTINGEVILRVRHNLLSPDKLAADKLKHIYAHPHALAQCRRWLGEHAPQAAQHDADSNAAAAKIAAGKAGKYTAAIGSQLSREHYKLTLLARDIEDYSTNSTRFLILGRQTPGASGKDKTSFIMTVKDSPGAMFEVLQPFSDNNVNMVKLESRPLPDRLWEYLFFVDCIGHQNDGKTQAALAEVAKRASFMKILGSYPQAV